MPVTSLPDLVENALIAQTRKDDPSGSDFWPKAIPAAIGAAAGAVAVLILAGLG